MSNSWFRKKRLWIVLTLGLMAVVGGLVYLFSFDPFGAQAMMAPPPGGHRFLGPPPPVGKVLHSQAAADLGLGVNGWVEADATQDHPLPVIRGEILTIAISFMPSGQGSGSQPAKIKRIVDNLQAGFFALVDVEAESDGNPINNIASTANFGIDQTITSSLIFDLTSLDIRPATQFELRLSLRALVNVSQLEIEVGNSQIEYGDESVDLPPAEVEIRDFLGPTGDVYAGNFISRDLADEKRGIDVLASQDSIDPWYQTVNNNRGGWYLPDFTLSQSGHPYQEYYNKSKKRKISRLKAEIAQQLPSNQIVNRLGDSSDQPQVYYCQGSLTINSPLTVRGEKVVIVKGNLIINKDINYSTDQAKIAFILEGPHKIVITRSVGKVNGYFFTDLECNSAAQCECLIQGSDYLRLSGAMVAQRVKMGGRKRKVSFVYDSRGVKGLPGIEGLLNAFTREVVP